MLWVEDSESDRYLIASALRDGEAKGLTFVPDGATALREVRRRRPALVVLDINLAGMDGIEVLRRLRADPALRMLPIIMLTTTGGA